MKKLKSFICLVFILCLTATTFAGCKKAKDLTESMITLSQTEYVYDGTEKKPNVMVQVGEDIVDRSYYSLAYHDNVNAGQATVVITAIGTDNKFISGSISLHFTIKPIELGNINPIAGKVYNGTNQVPSVSISGNSASDYTLSWRYKKLGENDSKYVAISGTEFVNAGVYEVTATGKGNYTGERKATYTISKANYENLTVSRNDYTYLGTKSDFRFSKEVYGDVAFVYSTSQNFENAKPLTKDTELNVGTYYFKAIIEESENVLGGTTAVSSFKVLPFNLSNLTIELEKEQYDYTGLEITPDVVVKNGSVVLTKDTDYTVAYERNIYATSEDKLAKVVVTGVGNYTGTAEKTFGIVIGVEPCLKHTPDEAFVENFVKATLDTDGGYDEVVYCEICKRELSREHHTIAYFDENLIHVDLSNRTYTGDAFEPQVEIEGYTESEDFIVTYENNKNAGTATILVSLSTENYEFETSYNFTIDKAVVTEPVAENATISFVYDGEIHRAVVATNEDLFNVSANNERTNAGEESVTITLADPYNYRWEIVTTESYTITLKIEKQSVNEPSHASTFTYNGNEHTAITHTSELYNITGDNTKVNAGSYEVYVTLADPTNYEWKSTANKTKTTLTYSYTIKKATVVEPTCESEFTYDGSEHTAITETSTLYNITGDNTKVNAGSYDVYVTLAEPANYEWFSTANKTKTTLTYSYTIHKAIVAEPIASGSVVTKTYNGQNQKAVSDYDDSLIVLSSENERKLADTYTVTVELANSDNYKWENELTASYTFTFVIAPYDLESEQVKGKIVLTKDSYVYNHGGSIEPEFEVIVGESLESYTFKLGSDDYDLSVTNNISVGDGQIEITAKGNFSGTVTATFEITPYVVQNPTITKSYTYNFAEQIVELINNDALVGLYEIVGTTNKATDAGEDYAVQVHLLDANYVWNAPTDEQNPSADLFVPFVIEQLDLSSGDLTVSITLDGYAFDFNGEPITPSVTRVTVKLGEMVYELTEDVDYTISYINNINKGAAFAVVNGTGNFKGSFSEMFTISAKTLQKPKIDYVNYTYEYNGNPQSPVFDIDVDTDFILVEGGNETDAGEYDITLSIKNPGSCVWSDGTTDSLVLKFYIEKYKVVNPQLVGTYTYDGTPKSPVFDANSMIDNFKYIMNSNFQQTDAGTTTISVQLKDYRNYEWKDNTNVDENGILYLYFVINKIEIVKPEIVGIYYYTGESQTAVLNWDGEEFEGFEYNNICNIYGREQTSVGSHEVTISLKDSTNYKWVNQENDDDTADVVLNYLIQDKDVESLTFECPESVEFTGSEIRPVVVKLGSVTLVENTHYIASYTNNINAGTATAKISGKEGSGYEGTKTLTFKISPVVVEKPVEKEWDYTYNASEQTKLFEKFPSLDIVSVEGNTQTKAGSYVVEVKLKGNYNNGELVYKNYIWEGENFEDDGVGASLTFDFVIQKYLVTKPTLQEPEKVYTFNFESQEMKFNSLDTLRVSVENNVQTEADTYDVVLSLNDDSFGWQGETDEEKISAPLHFEFVINKFKVNVPVVSNSYTYNGGEQVIVAENQYYSVQNGTLFEVTNEDHTISVTLKNSKSLAWNGIYPTDTITFTTRLVPLSVNSITYSISSYYYTGEAIEPKLTNVTIVLNDIERTLTLEEDEGETQKDYKLSYDKNINATDESNKAVIKVTGHGNYAGEKIIYFDILPVDLEDNDVKLTANTVIYNRFNQQPEFTVTHKLGSHTLSLVLGTDYTVAWTKNYQPVGEDEFVDAGTYTLKVEGKGNYSKALYLDYVIEKYTYDNLIPIKDNYSYDSSSETTFSDEIYSDYVLYYRLKGEQEWNNYFDELPLSYGTYELYASFVETENYNSYETDVVTFKVLKAQRTDISAFVDNSIYGETLNISVKQNDENYEGDYNLWYYAEGETEADKKELSVETKLDAGTYYYFLTIDGDENYEPFSSDALAFTVSAIDYIAGSILVRRESYEYSTIKTIPYLESNSVDVSKIDSNFVTYYYNTTSSNENGTPLYNEGNLKELSVGTYYIYAVIASHGNYNEYTSPVSTFSVTKGNHFGIEVQVSSVTYGENPSPSLSVADLEGTITYYYTTENSNNGGIVFDSGTPTLSAGTYYMYAIISGNDNFENYTTNQKEFEVLRFVVEKPVIISKSYNGFEQRPIDDSIYYNVTVKDNEKCLQAKKYDVTVSLVSGNYVWSDNTTDDMAVEFEILKVDISSLAVEHTLIDGNAYDYNGTSITPEIALKLSATQLTISSSEYEVSYENNTQAGTATLIITASEDGNFYGTRNVGFTINKINYSSDLIAEKPSYSYLGSSTARFTILGENYSPEGVCTYYYNLINSNENGTLLTDLEPIAAGDYYFYAVIAESTNYFAYTTQTTPFTISKIDLASAVVTLEHDTYIYEDEAIVPGIVSVTINGNSVPNDENVNYTVSYQDNDHAGTAKVILTATEDGSLYGIVIKPFTISSALSFSDAEVVLEEDEFVYNGLAIDDRIVMTVTLGGNTLIFGTDYTWATIGDSTNAGIVTIQVTGLGKYAGEETSVTCEILPVQMSDLTIEFSQILSDEGDYAFIIYPEYDIENNINPYIVISYNGEEFNLDDFEIVWYDENGDMVDMFFNNGYYYATISSNNPNFNGDPLVAVLTVELWEI